VIWKWCARAAWVALPFTAGVAFADGLDGWSRVPAGVAMVLLWAGWLAGAIALFAPRPWGFSVLRVVAPTALVLAVVAGAPAATRALAIAVALVACVLVLGAPVARACANSIAYGDEDRYPLAVPITIMCAPLPIAVVLVAGGVATGPLLLADRRWVVGAIALVVGWPLAVLAANSVHALSRRWLVYVPAGVVVVDSLTLADPTLMPREQIEAITVAAVDGALDLRLAPAHGSITIVLHEGAYFARRRGRADAEVLTADAIRVAVVDRNTMLDVAGRRRITARR
jgi:hypothetical protein